MEVALEKLRAEVGSLQKEEQSKLEEEKKKALDRLQKMVGSWKYVLLVLLFNRNTCQVTAVISFSTCMLYEY